MKNLKQMQAEMRERNERKNAPAFPKPSQKEGKITLAAKARRQLLDRFCKNQGNLCITCYRRMTREPGNIRTATLGHRNPEPMGCKKRDNFDNFLGAQCWLCNMKRGSKR